MISNSKKLRFAALGVAAGMILAACGGGSDDEAAEKATNEDGTLTIGMLLPATGSLAFLGYPEFAGVELAIQDMNAAGGVLGKDVVGVRADSGDGEPNIAPAETDKLLNAKADAIVGAAASGVSMAVIDKITGAGVVQISPSNTAPGFDTYEDGGFYFRTAPSDVLQGAVLGNLLSQEGKKNVAIMARQDDYGEALANQVEKTFTEAGGTVAAKVFYDPNASTFGTDVQKVADAKPDAVVLVSFDESARIIPALADAGVGPQQVGLFLCDGNLADYSATGSKPLPEGLLQGAKGTLPGAASEDDFKARLMTVDPTLKEFAYAPESYDAAIILGLATIAAGKDGGANVAAEMINVTTGGEKCTTFADCVKLLEGGSDIDYDGISGPIEFGETGSPTAAAVGIYEYKDASNTYELLESVNGKL